MIKRRQMIISGVLIGLLGMALLPVVVAQEATPTPPIWPTVPTVGQAVTPTPPIWPTMPIVTTPPAATLDPMIAPTMTLYPFWGTYTPPAATPVYNVPAPVPLLPVDNDALVNVLLLGSDSPDDYLRRTDVMVLVSINTVAKTAAMWRIPRHLFVYIPNHTLDLINTVYVYGEADAYPGGGFGLLQDTFRYNFGIELDHFARVNYPGFMQLIELLGGLDISVDCAIRDWRLKDPDFDPAVEDNWEMYELGVGRAHLSPYMALWYVRSRKTTDELDRGRRQMDVLRAMWQQIKTQGLLAHAAEFWPLVLHEVDTDLQFADLAPLLALGAEIDLSDVARYSGTVGLHYTMTYTPDNGREVLLPNRAYLLPMLEDFLTPPTGNRLGRTAFSVDVIDASWYNMGLERVAADRLAWEGFQANVLPGISPTNREWTIIFDYTGQTKGSALPDLQRILRATDGQIVQQPDPNRTVDYRVEIGTEYRLCTYGNAEDDMLIAPWDSATLPETPTATCALRFRAAVNIRTGPDTTYDILDQVTPSDEVPVTGRTLAGTWWRVDRDGEIGWVAAGLVNVVLAGDCSSVVAVATPTP